VIESLPWLLLLEVLRLL
jgi:hypothetical protein